MVYTHLEILFNLEREGNSDKCCSMDEPEDIMLSEVSRAPKDKHWWVHLYEGLRVLRLIETESRMGARAGGRGGASG